MFVSRRNTFLTGSLVLCLLSSCSNVSAEICDDSCVRDALSALYESAGGSGWGRSDNWLDLNMPVESWWGIDKFINVNTTEVTWKVVLARNNLVGTIPFDEWIFPNIEIFGVQGNPALTGTISENISTFTSLKSITLRDTGITGPLPSGFFSLASLEIADLKSVDMTGVALSEDWGLLTSLKTLHLQGTDIAGGVPVHMFDLTNLELLNLSNNVLRGTLPSEIGNLRKLKDLRIDRISLTGTIPSTLFDLPLLERLDAYSMPKLKGTIPDTVNSLSMLKTVQLHKCGFNGTLPAFSGSGMLTSLKLHNNKLTGSIPENFLDQTAMSTEVVTVDLMSNMLTGAVPESLNRFDDMFITLADNMLTDVPLSLCSEDSRWMGGLISEYGCNSLLCPIGTYNPLGRQTADAVCEPCETGCFYGEFTCKNDPCPTHSPTVVTMSPTTSSPTTSQPTATRTNPPTFAFMRKETASPTSVLVLTTSPTEEATTMMPTTSPTEENVATTMMPTATKQESVDPTNAPISASPTQGEVAPSPVEDDNDSSVVTPELGVKGIDKDVDDVNSFGVVLGTHAFTVVSLMLSGAFLM